jgi:hypothetical protein
MIWVAQTQIDHLSYPDHENPALSEPGATLQA